MISFLRRPVKAGWAVAGQLAAASLVLVGFVTLREAPDTQIYRAQGSAPADAAGNLLVLFQPDSSEREMRAALMRAGARVVDGPTASGAYVLKVADANRPGALEQLRAAEAVLLAEPVDAP